MTCNPLASADLPAVFCTDIFSPIIHLFLIHVDPLAPAYNDNSHANRMQSHAIRRGINLTSRSRPLTPADLSTFDLILGMDPKNIAAINRAADYWRENGMGDVPDAATVQKKVKMMTEYAKGKFKGSPQVPDPYYGGAQGFELVLDMLDDACTGLLEEMTEGKAKV
jgi:protein-tyrosine-phosphatase